MNSRKVDWISARPFAHRGLHDRIARPENSLAALRWAVDEGFGVEIDVRVLSDGAVVLFHDEDLMRMTGVPGAIEQRAWSDISTLRLRQSGEQIPTLASALQLIDARAPVLIDLKSADDPPEAARLVCEVLRGYQGVFAIISRNTQHLIWLRRHEPGTIRGQVFDFEGTPGTPGTPGVVGLLSRLMLARRQTRPDLVAFDLLGLSSWRAWLINTLVPLVVWTVVTPSQWRWAQTHASNFMFELSAQLSLAEVPDQSGRIGDKLYEPGSVCGRVNARADGHTPAGHGGRGLVDQGFLSEGFSGPAATLISMATDADPERFRAVTE